MCFVSSDITSISEWYLLDQTYWVTNRLELLFVDSTLIVSKRQHDRKVAKNTFLARSTAERCKHRTTSLVSSMIAALWAFTVRLSLSYSEETPMLTADRRDRDDWNTMLKSKPRGWSWPRKGNTSPGRRGTHHTHGRHMMRLFVIYYAYEPMRIESFKLPWSY